MLFLRPAAQTFLKGLDSLSGGIIEGPPGVGKSSLMWLWCLLAPQSAKPILWIHITKLEIEFCLLRNSSCCSAKGRIEDVRSVLSSVASQILVVDGLSKKNQETLLLDAWEWKQVESQARKLFLVSSEQVNLAPDSDVKIERLALSSWKMSDYLLAVQNQDFLRLVSPMLDQNEAENDEESELESILNSKFYFAGGSARWMFGKTTTEVIGAVKYYLDRHDDPRALTRGFTGSRAKTSINHLLQEDEHGKVFLVSEYVTIQLAIRFRASFIAEARTLGNPAFDGWVFAADFFNQLHEAKASNQSLAPALPDGR